MKELDELRRVAGGRNTVIGAEIYKLCDAIERELAERYMELPVDADGMPWHIGDAVDGHGTVQSMGLNRYGWHFVGVENAINPALHRHAKPDTIEDVLTELTDRAWDFGYRGVCDKEPQRELVTKYAERIERVVRDDRVHR